ncbi:kinase-like domain-containing protein [Pisolithus croceorrhizus]|nr:kinase-like domain-containing protein [Pisolithus croceorrhizus]KAI6109432.1 kinase-like domain-containing protein [Pisolithus croceorrhizus]
MAEDDAVSTFSYDDEADPDTFSLYQLGVAIDSHFGEACHLKKLAEGGYHKVYEVLQKDGTVLGVVRVAAPAFPKDKLESEVATLKYLAAQTQIPVPQVYAWNSDASNPVGAEYIIMQKMPGVSANTKWDTLSMSAKERTVSQVTEYLKAMFALRFDRAGSLYLSSPSKDDVYVGPIVSIPFFSAIDGVVRVPDADPPSHIELSQYRGPFSNTTEYLQSFLRAELHILSQHRSTVLSELEEEADEETAASRLELGERVLRKALELCSVYPGNDQPGGPISTPTQPFSLNLDDFRLSNIMIDEESGDVTSLIDFEGATIAPLWECTVIPAWLQDPDDQEGGYEGGAAEDREKLREIFWKIMDSDEWSVLYEHGKLFRHFRLRLSLQVGPWASEYMEEWVDKRLAWAKLHPGVAMPEEDYY